MSLIKRYAVETMGEEGFEEYLENLNEKGDKYEC